MKKLSKLFAIALIFSIIFSGFSVPAHASSTGGGLSSNDKWNGKGTVPSKSNEYWTPIKWVIIENVPKDTVLKSTVYSTGHSHHQLKAKDGIAFLTMGTYNNDQAKSIYDKWMRWSDWTSKLNQRSVLDTKTKSFYWSGSPQIPQEYINIARLDGYTKVHKAGFLYEHRSDGTYLDAIWKRGPNHQVWSRKEKEETKNVIVRVENTGDPSKNFNDSSRSNEWLFSNGKTGQVQISYTSKPNEFSYTHNIKVWQKTIVKKTTWEESDWGNTRNRKVTYSSRNPKNVTKVASWSQTVPGLDRTMFLPVDLKDGKQVSASSLGSLANGYTVKNTPVKVNISHPYFSDKKYPQGLDNNQATRFSIKYNNDQFGIPRKSEGGIDISKNKPAYSSSVDGVQLYFNPVLSMGIKKSSSVPVASFESGGSEIKDGTFIQKNHGFRGEDSKFRSIKSGVYPLSGKVGNNEYPYWMVTYQSIKYYKYGSKYTTVIRPGSSGPTFSNSVAPNNIRINDNKIHLGDAQSTMIQPIIKGQFEVKTVGGYKTD